MDGKTFTGRERVAILTNLTAVSALLGVKAAATQGQVTVAGAGDLVEGVLAANYDAVATAQEVRFYDARDGDVLPVVTGAAVGRLTGGKPTPVVPTAGGKFIPLPSTPGTYEVFGDVDVSSPASTLDGDVVWVKVRRRQVSVGADETPGTDELLLSSGGPGSDIGAGATSTKPAYICPTGIAATLVRLTLDAGTAAGATVDLKVDGTSIVTDGPKAVVSGGLTIIEADELDSAAVAAGEQVDVVIVTAASTGDCDAPHWFLKLAEAAA